VLEWIHVAGAEVDVIAGPAPVGATIAIFRKTFHHVLAIMRNAKAFEVHPEEVEPLLGVLKPGEHLAVG